MAGHFLIGCKSKLGGRILTLSVLMSHDDSRRGYLMYLSDRDVPFFRVSISPIFCSTGYPKRRQIFWSSLSKHVNRETFVTTDYYLVKSLCFLVYFSPISS